ncbi:MAG: aminotransferase class V-fold PLP-dependent enzyme [Trueperaceae bacterium]|nr:aminotransferase class V-fold PLP-dependent enzyme [Trueperaceae bacterium]
MTKPTGEVLLLTPGPTPIHPRALAAMQWPMRGHMDPEVFAYNDALVADLARLYGAEEGAFPSLLSGTGSLGMEAGLANLLERGERLLVASNGAFGERMAMMGSRLGLEVSVVRAAVGDAIDPDELRQVARRVRPKVISVVHGETSTGVLNPLPAIAEVAHEVDALLSVDAVTTVGMMPFGMAELGIDYAYTGSQKCLSAPPGLAPVVYSARAMEAVEARRLPPATWYADAHGMRAYWDPGGARAYHHTIPVQLHWATGEAIRAALEEGMEVREARVRRLGQAVLASLAPEGFAPFVPEGRRLPTVLALTLPPGLNDRAVRHALRHQHAISVAGGLGRTEGRIWRLGLMGENARVSYYRRLMQALAEILDAPALPERFDAAAVASAGGTVDEVEVPA